MGKIYETRKLYKEVLEEITTTEENWQKFLNSSAWNFKYDFDNQILIYAQRPDAKACASMSEWNKKLKRWINVGTKPIYIFDKDANSQYPFRLVFDLSDTHNKDNTEYKLWGVKREYEKDIIESLSENFGEIINEAGLPQAIKVSSYNMTEDSFEDYLEAIIKNKKNSKMENLADEEIKTIVLTSVWASVSYMIMTRCGIDAKKEINKSEFEFIKYFDTPELVNIFGTSVSDIAEMGLREIAKTVFELKKSEKLKNRTLEKINQELYADNNKSKEEKKYDEENRVHESGRLLHAKSNNEKREDTKGQVFANEVSIFENSQEIRANKSNNERETNRTSNTNSRRNDKESERVSGEDENKRGNNRRIEEEESNEVGRLNEQYKDGSRENSGTRTDIQLEEENQRITLTEDDMKTNKDFLQDKYTSMLLTNIQNLSVSKDEIKKFYKQNKNQIERAEFIKKAFSSNAYNEIVVDDVRLGYKTYKNVLHLWKGNYLNRTAEVYYNWKNIAEYIDGLILVNEFNDLYKPIKDDFEENNLLKVEANNASTFSFTQEIIDYALTSTNSERKMKINNLYERKLPQKENITFLKNEYGWSGTSSIKLGSRVGMDTDAKGITLYRGYEEDSARILINWNNVEKRISELIKEDRYFNQKEKEEYKSWKEEKEKEEQIQKSLEKLERSETKSIEERLLTFYKENNIFDKEYSENFKEEIPKLKEELRDISSVSKLINYLKEVKQAEDSDIVLCEEIDYYINELTKINEENKEYDIAKRLNEFVKDFEIYQYIDNYSYLNRSKEDDIELIKSDINDSRNVRDYYVALKKSIENNKINEEKLKEAIELLEILKERVPKYEYHLGDKVYIGADEYEIAGIKENVVTLFDTKFPILNKQMDFDEFEKKIQENYSNDHLKVKNRKDEIEEIENEKNKVSIESQKEDKEIISIEDKKIEENKIRPKIKRAKSKIQDYILYPDIPIEERNNFKILDKHLGEGTPREKFERNINAIKTLKKCNEECRYATEEEQKILSQYIGWGGLAQAFDPSDSSWSKEYSILKNLLTKDEYENARASTLTAFYTPPVVIDAIYEILQRMGLKEANILEPSCRCRKLFRNVTIKFR